LIPDLASTWTPSQFTPPLESASMPVQLVPI